MANANIVCSMCGDVGFADKLFLCSRCNHRFQHSYCTNYYEEATLSAPAVCDWCISESRSTSESKRGSSILYSKKLMTASRGHSTGSSGDGSGDDGKVKLKQGRFREETRGRGKSGATSTASSKPTGRRYKLLKDVLC